MRCATGRTAAAGSPWKLATLHGDATAVADELESVLPAVQQRLADWRGIPGEETAQARQMVRSLLRGRLVFNPRPDEHGVEFTGRGDYGQLFAGLIRSQALASPTGMADFHTIAGSARRAA